MHDRSEPNGREHWTRHGVLLTRTWSDTEAVVIRQLLGSYGIPCQVISDVPHAVFPIAVDGLGEIRILVSWRHVETARTLLADHLRQGLRVLRGGKSSGTGDPDDSDEQGAA